MRRFWNSLKFWLTDSFASRGRTVPVDDLMVGSTELGWGSKAPRTDRPEEDLMVPAGELGWGTKAPKTNLERSPGPTGEATEGGLADADDD